MPISMILKELKSGERCKAFELRLILQIAALLKDKRESGMIMVSEWEMIRLRKILHGIGIRYVVLVKKKTQRLVFLFRSERLSRTLGQEEVKAFLTELGYDVSSLGMLLQRLESRFSQYMRDNCFPHEIGLFLGYPLCDVKGFMEHNGEACLHSGYWKIYDNENQTLKRFHAFDIAKQTAIREWFSGKSITEIAV